MRTSIRVFLLLCLPVANAWTTEYGVVPGTHFQRHTARDRFGRAVTFYVSGPQSQRPVPLAAFVQGTGCSSLFQRAGARVVQGPQALLYEASRGRVRVLAVEKPGVQFLDEQSGEHAKVCRPEFLGEHTLDRWTEAIVASIRAAQELPGIDRSKTLVVGASEGGVIAVHASNVARSVTHAASIGGGGPNHLFSLAEYVRRGRLDPEVEVFGCWAEVLRFPDAADKFCWGQPHRLWSRLLRTSLLRECLQSRAALYLAHGTADQQSSVAGFDVMRAELAAQGRSAVFDRIEGADHSLARGGDRPGDGFRACLERIVDWFVTGAP